MRRCGEHRDLHDGEQHDEDRQAPELITHRPSSAWSSAGGGAVVEGGRRGRRGRRHDRTLPWNPAQHRDVRQRVEVGQGSTRDTCRTRPVAVRPRRSCRRRALPGSCCSRDRTSPHCRRRQPARSRRGRDATDPNPRRPRAMPLTNPGCTRTPTFDCGSMSSSTFEPPFHESRTRPTRPSGPITGMSGDIPDSSPLFNVTVHSKLPGERFTTRAVTCRHFLQDGQVEQRLQRFVLFDRGSASSRLVLQALDLGGERAGSHASASRRR